MVRDYALNEMNILVFFEAYFKDPCGSIFVFQVLEKNVYSGLKVNCSLSIYILNLNYAC